MSLILLQFREPGELRWLKPAVALSQIMRGPPDRAAGDKLIFYKCICKFPVKLKGEIHKKQTRHVLTSTVFPIWSLKDALFSTSWFFMCPTKSPSVLLNSCRDADDSEDSSLRYSCFAFCQPSGDKWFIGSKVFIAIQIKRNHSASELPWSVLLGGGVEGWG